VVSSEGGASRRALLRGAGAALSGGIGAITVAACGRAAKTGHAAAAQLRPAVKRHDLAILRQALELERRTVAAYVAGIPLLDRDQAKTAKQFLNEELQHTGELIALVTATGAKASPRAASYDLGRAPRDATAVLALLHSLEALQIASYLRWIPELSPAPVRAAVATILAADAQHIAMLRLTQGLAPAPSAFVTGSE
jgi:hypothetical protein